MTTLNIGDLVFEKQVSNFKGIGKLESIDEVKNQGVVGFFTSPDQPSGRCISVDLNSIDRAKLFDEQNVYVIDERYKLWRQGRYGGQRPCGNHLVQFVKNIEGELDNPVFPLFDIYVLNLLSVDHINPGLFLAHRCVDSPFFYNSRRDFIAAYISQQVACRSISAIPSSSIELEPHQLAVVRQVLNDSVKKYILADEVGLGKTIEAGLILKELLFNDINKKAIVAVPETLVSQWISELSNRFHLDDLFRRNLVVCNHQELPGLLENHHIDILIIDEVHQMSPWAWSLSEAEKASYQIVADGCHRSVSCLLLSGTPLNGNEKNFLAILHLLTPESYKLTEGGLVDFKQKVSKMETVGQIYSSLMVSSDNVSLSESIERIKDLFPTDELFKKLVNESLPLLDWMASEDSDERTDIIMRIKTYIGDNFRLYQRQLRNRRSDASIAGVFPTLAGVTTRRWSINSVYSTEQLLEMFRIDTLTQGSNNIALTAEKFRGWLEDLFISPLKVEIRAKEILFKFSDKLGTSEKVSLIEIVECAEQEQSAKDNELLSSLSEWLDENPMGQCVVYCSDSKVADHVASFLDINLQHLTERHLIKDEPKFVTDKTYRVLICDENGEDGLNLNGGTKLLLHYSVPMSLSRIEQRIGRANRYSAHIVATPVQNLVLLPEGNSYSSKWHELLADAVGIYTESIASLQYVLEDYIENMLNDLAQTGVDGIDNLTGLLAGDKGIVAREKKSVELHELLYNMDDKIEEAKIFADQVTEGDERAEKEQSLMFGWITKALHFQKIRGEIPDTFRFKYQPQRTFIDLKVFLTRCFSGIDLENSIGQNVVTNMMSADRQLVSHGNKVYPFRIGQSFVEVIYKEMENDTRGVCTAMLRVHKIKALGEKNVFFKIDYVLTAQSEVEGDAHDNWSVGGDRLPSKVLSSWHKDSGEILDDETLLEYVSKTQENDVQVKAEHWVAIEGEYPADEWSDIVKQVTLVSGQRLHAADAHVGYTSKMMAIKVLFVVLSS